MTLSNILSHIVMIQALWRKSLSLSLSLWFPLSISLGGERRKMKEPPLGRGLSQLSCRTETEREGEKGRETEKEREGGREREGEREAAMLTLSGCQTLGAGRNRWLEARGR